MDYQKIASTLIGFRLREEAEYVGAMGRQYSAILFTLKTVAQWNEIHKQPIPKWLESVIDTTISESSVIETGQDASVNVQERAALLASLKVMTGLCAAKYGNLDAEVFEEIQKANYAITKAEAAQ